MSMNTTRAAAAATPSGGPAPGAATPHQGWLTQLLLRIRAEYEEMPGLCLTRPQAQRLWGLDHEICETVLQALVEVGYLRKTASGYVRS